MEEVVTKFNTLIDHIRKVPFDKIPETKRHNYSLFDLSNGNTLKLKGTPYVVEDKYRYEDVNGWEWFEYKLRNLDTGENEFLEVEDDDGLVLYHSFEKIKINETDVGDIEELLNSRRTNVKAKGDTYSYIEDYDVTFYKDGKSTNAHVFEFENGNTNLAFEQWNGSLECWLSKKVSEHQIKIIA